MWMIFLRDRLLHCGYSFFDAVVDNCAITVRLRTMLPVTLRLDVCDWLATHSAFKLPDARAMRDLILTVYRYPFHDACIGAIGASVLPGHHVLAVATADMYQR